MSEHIIYDFVQSTIELSMAMAPYILFGLLIAGIMHEAMPQDFIKRHLGKSSLGSVIKATLFGIPIPVCSCGVIPLAASLKKSGASKGSVLSFLISTPITGIDSILATFGIFGLAFTIYRIVTSTIIAIAAGIFTNILVKEPPKPAFSLAPQKPILSIKQESSCSDGCGCESETKRRFSLTRALHYGFVTLFGDIAKPLFWGLLLGALISVATPKDLATTLSAHPALSYLLVLAMALPMYVCATASLPIAAALVLNGVSLGAAFVFLSAGPATNTVTMGVVKDMLGKRALGIYLATIAVGSILFGILLDLWIGEVDLASYVHLPEEPSFIAKLSALAMWGGIVYHLYRAKAAKSCCA